MFSLRVFAVVVVLLGFSVSSLANDGYLVSGKAFNLKTGKLAYRELITGLDENKEVQVNYAKPDGVIFARKTLNYSTEVFQPGFVLDDERDDETVSAVFDAGRLLLTHRTKGNSQTKTLYETSKLIIDAGVDSFIQQQWPKLTAGKKIEFEVADARHLGIEKFVIKEVDASVSPLAYKGAGETWKYFRVDTANKLSSIFTEPMHYAYEPDGQYLMRYQGRANIDNESGEAWDVRIEYEYF
ncbi:hypothetical protein GCM10011613_15060 [Cellvibrio zantedeschiae]|uniref:DUF4198 domain-containing protein n=1 Tax=Cellvibrio zantedeschiae TaxID=1237077 RepID=A0ABQ3AY25_9GAMM|nr:hypothetical protein [Cellvibrio zantedeschiae]GGY71339.1 hypothetical protein GCM10011613_15060 [Cellvibrio zantedeschiae]